MYDASDPRSTLSSNKAPAAIAGAAGQPWDSASCIHFKSGPPQEEDAYSRTWYGRGQNFIVCYVEAKAGAQIRRTGQADEYVLIVPEAGTAVDVQSEHGNAALPGHTVAFVPPGASTIRVTQPGRLFLLFTTRSTDLADKTSNRDIYAQPHHHVAPLVNWPDAVDGPKLRWYDMEVADEPGRFGRIWRCSTFMVNLLVEHQPRDIEKVSPHHHDDFEQCSLMLDGTMSHHLRWPWTTNMRHWREDQHLDCHSPSMTVIPPPAIHTSNATGGGAHVMFDVFCPPRTDFSLKPGWVLNAAEYPMPGEAQKKAAA